MLVNRKSSGNNRVEFVSYDGAWPNLCSGVLTLNIDGEIVKFGHHCMSTHWHEDIQQWVHEDEDPNKPNYESFWSSGGSCGFKSDWTDEYVYQAEWKIDIEELPEKFWDLADELDRVINENIPQGCCGGCL